MNDAISEPGPSESLGRGSLRDGPGSDCLFAPLGVHNCVEGAMFSRMVSLHSTCTSPPRKHADWVHCTQLRFLQGLHAFAVTLHALWLHGRSAKAWHPSLFFASIIILTIGTNQLYSHPVPKSTHDRIINVQLF